MYSRVHVKHMVVMRFAMFSAEDYFVGERYIRFDDEIGRDDEAVMPLYDVNGFIAGLQVAVRKPAC